MGPKATPIQIVPKSLKDVKAKVPKIQEISFTLDSGHALTDLKTTTDLFHYKNMIPIPDFLIKTFIQLDDTKPVNAVTAFYQALLQMETSVTAQDTTFDDDEDTDTDPEDEETDQDKTPIISSKSPKQQCPPTSMLSLFGHVIQFCYLCIKGRITPLLYTIATDDETCTWFHRIELSSIIHIPTTIHSSYAETSTCDEDESFDSHRSMRSSRDKDTHIVHTLLKISETLDQNSLRATAETEKKEPGFKKLEPHRQQFILNASSAHPFESEAATPTPFYVEFLSQKQQFKAKELLCHHLAKNKILFQPTAAFASHIYNVDWVWTNPNKPYETNRTSPQSPEATST